MPNQPLAQNDPLKGKVSGSWSKHGGGGYGLRKAKIEEEWTCQICARTSPAELRPFLFELFLSEYIRVCGICQSLIQKSKAKDNQVIFRRVVKITRTYKD